MTKPKNIIGLVLALCLMATQWAEAQKTSVQRVEPLNWWVGMANPNLQLLVYGPNIADAKVSINYNGVELKQVIKVSNPNYLFLNLVIDKKCQPGTFDIIFSSGKKTVATYPYQLLAREQGSAQRQGFNSSDAMYLILPDRFANGNINNDEVAGMIEKPDRTALKGRHGGDLQGIEEHLGFVRDLGMTAIWINPVQENNQTKESFHGYGITDYYKIDPRFGTNADFKKLVATANKNGLKVIMDMVFNHCGINHWWMNDLPSNDWINQWPSFTRSNYRLSTVSDTHVAQTDLDLATKGWFDNTMPDLNLLNPLTANYMIQNSIWWIEYAGLQGIRQDTYPYPNKEGMRQWNLRISEEYPNFNIVGECWITSTSKLSYWQKDQVNRDGYDSELPSVFDFPLMDAMHKAFNEKEGWDNGLVRLYDVLADDYLYPNPDNLVVFAENHDIGRITTILGDDIRKFKMVMAFLATTRGTPQLYYGSEILMKGNKGVSDAELRYDFPGGWPGDKVNAFTPQGRTKEENEALNYMSTVFNYRKNNAVLHTGRLLHYIPQNEVYVYFRILGDKTVMVIMNNADDKSQSVSTARFTEAMNGFTKGKNIETGAAINDLTSIEVPAKSALILELSK
jgi:glycosidase